MGVMISQEKLQYYKEMVSNFPCVAFVSVDNRAEGTIRVLCANAEYYTLTGIEQDTIESGDHDISNLSDIATEDKIRVLTEFGTAAQQMSTVAMDASVKRIDSTYMRCRIHARPLEKIGDAVFFVVTFHRYDDKDPETIIKKHYVEHDALTNIFNMKGFCQQTAELLATYPERHFTIVVSDIDSFKTINNMFGDEVGDQILIMIGRKLKEHFAMLFRNGVPGSYGRIGSDRFAVCLPSDMVDPERFVGWIDESITQLDINYRIFIHLGLCEVPENTLEISDIIEQAYLACATVKHNMRQRYAFYDYDLRRILLEEQELVSQAEKALKKGEFITYFQPVYLANSKKLISAEALVRWDHPERGLLTPGAFIPVMEHNGFISQLDFSVWRSVLGFMRRRLDEGKKIVPISVNMSRQDIFHPKLAEELLELLTEYRIDPTYLHIEVTESAYIDEEVQTQLASTIHELRQKGFIILMDDFGSGYSSLNVLKDMPVDIMKIDRGLMADVDSSDRAKAMLSTIVRLANRLYIPIIAEGVETEQQYNYLRGIGCDSIQGYYFSRPVSEAEFEKLLDEGDVPEYTAGESIPGRFTSRDRDDTPFTETVLLVGDYEEGAFTPAEILCNDYHVRRAAGRQEAEEILREGDGADYVILTRAEYEALIRDGKA